MEFILHNTLLRFATLFLFEVEKGDDTEEKVLSDDVLDDDDGSSDSDDDTIGPEEIEEDDTFMDTNGRVEWEE